MFWFDKGMIRVYIIPIAGGNGSAFLLGKYTTMTVVYKGKKTELTKDATGVLTGPSKKKGEYQEGNENASFRKKFFHPGPGIGRTPNAMLSPARRGMT